jgi:hypothetical protein
LAQLVKTLRAAYLLKNDSGTLTAEISDLHRICGWKRSESGSLNGSRPELLWDQNMGQLWEDGASCR